MFERRRAPMPIEDLEAPPRGKKSHAFAASATC